MKAFYKSGVLIVLALVFSLGIGTTHGAPKFPGKPIVLVAHASPGGGADIYARTIAAGIEKYKLLPQPMVVENKTGGSGAVAYAYVAGKKKDPYFLLTSTGSFLTTPLQGLTPITYKDFTPIANFWLDENILMVNANSKYKSAKDIVADAKANPRKVTVGGTSVGGPGAICIYQLEKAAGIQVKFVNFPSGGELVAAVLGGHVDSAVGNPGEVLELTKANKIRVLGVFAQKRLVEAPNIPTFKEQGFEVQGAPNNRGICAPADIPEDAQKVLEEALFKFTKTEIFKNYTKDNMLAEAWMNGPMFGKWLEEWNGRYREVFKEMGLLKK